MSSGLKLDCATEGRVKAVKLALRDWIIAQGGQVSFEDYMAFALYDRQWGYYQQDHFHIGPRGDFITAAQSEVFASCLLHWVKGVWLRGVERNILEFGPGQGHLAAHLLARLDAEDALPGQYWLCEISESLVQQQKVYLRSVLSDRAYACCHWGALDALPSTLSAAVIGNELLDAFPVTWFRWNGVEIERGIVRWQGDDLTLDYESVDQSLDWVQRILPLSEAWPQGYTSEINLGLDAWFERLGATIHRSALLLIDYGFMREVYYHVDRSMGTWMGHFRHHSIHDPLLLPGVCDMTAHVDFTAVAEAAERYGFKHIEIDSQANFLLAHGLGETVDQTLDPEATWTRSQDIKRLMLPSEMGELFLTMTAMMV